MIKIIRLTIHRGVFDCKENQFEIKKLEKIKKAIIL